MEPFHSGAARPANLQRQRTTREATIATYVLVHGAWHSGELLEDVAAAIRDAGHVVHTPTIAGNRPGDPKTTRLADAVKSIVDYLIDNDLTDIVLFGHSYGGIVITGAADAVPERIRRLIYCNAFVPNDGESLIDMSPPNAAALFEALSAQSPDGSLVLPFPVWREAFFNDGDAEAAKAAFDRLNPQPYATFTDKIALRTNPAEMPIAKSYINATEDTALPQSFGWHPRLSEKLGLFRLVQTRGSHELCFTNPALLAEAILTAARD